MEPRSGFLARGVSRDLLTLQTGAIFDWSKFKAASDVSQFKLEGNTMFVFIDPNETTTKKASAWLNLPGKGYRKLTISVGQASSGFFDPSGLEIRKMTSSTPMFVMVNKDSKIIGMWLGFDPANTKDFEADILKALG